MKRDVLKFELLFVLIVSVLNACKKDAPEPTTGFLSGTVMNGDVAVAGALVVAENGNNAFSSVTGADGVYYIYNVLAATYNVKAYKSDFNSDEISTTVSSNTESTENNLSMTEGAAGEVSGLVTFLAVENGVVDVSLTHLITKETIPGLVTTTEATAYTISNVPNGSYIARASYGNDGYVVDPDWIIKNGEPIVTINDNVVTRNFSVTGAVELTSPTNEASTTVPVEITETATVFTWVAYSSTSDYIIEVSDINGNIIWGGFSGEGANVTKNITIPKNQLSITFNSDNNASSDLKLNTVYRWRIFASKDDTQEATGWKLISGSEEQRGLFIIK